MGRPYPFGRSVAGVPAADLWAFGMWTGTALGFERERPAIL